MLSLYDGMMLSGPAGDFEKASTDQLPTPSQVPKHPRVNREFKVASDLLIEKLAVARAARPEVFSA